MEMRVGEGQMQVSEGLEEEIEALEAILGNDFGIQQDETTGRPLIKLDFCEESPKVEFSLFLCMPPSYPEDCPSVTVQPGKGFPAIWRSRLLQFLKEEMSLLVGTPMIFELYTRTKDWILDQDNQGEESEVVAKIALGKSPEENRVESSTFISSLVEEKDYGTPVTKESFEKWRQSFFEQFGLSLRKKEKDSGLKPTGRQLFEENRLVDTSETYDSFSSEDEE